MKFKSIKNWNITLIVFGSILLVAILLCILFGGNEIRMMKTNISLSLFVWIDAFLIGSLWFMLYQDFYVVEKDYVQINKFILAKKEIAYTDIKSVTIDTKNVFLNKKTAEVVTITYINKKGQEKTIVTYPEDAKLFVGALSKGVEGK
jgi:hypothetical protein